MCNVSHLNAQQFVRTQQMVRLFSLKCEDLLLYITVTIYVFNVLCQSVFHEQFIVISLKKRKVIHSF